MSRMWRVLVSLALASTLLLPASPASAHKRLPQGKYLCYQYYNFGPAYTNYDLHIMSNQRYEYRFDGDLVGSAGRFRHPDDSAKIRFTSGYLKAKNWRGSHKPSNGVITLKRPTNDGYAYLYCSKDD